MFGYIVRRLLALFPILLGVSLLVFVAAHVMPGNIAQIKVGMNATPEQIAEVEHQYGLDKPVIEQYFLWLNDLLHFDLGDSLLSDQSVGGEIKDRLPITLELIILTVTITSILGITMGLVSARYHGRFIDSFLRGVSILGMSVPTFWVATLVILIPSIYFSYAPPLGHVSILEDPWGNLTEYLPPAMAMGFASACGLARVVRGSVLGVVGQDFMRTARAKGLAEGVIIRRHALGNVMMPIITILGMETVGLIGGTVIIERVFNINGIGGLVWQSAFSRDYTTLQATALMISFAVMFMFLVIDVLYGWLDPRVRLTGGQRA